MPNWCENTLKVLGKEKELKKFRIKVATKKTALSLEKLFPLPKALKDTKSPVEKPNKKLIKKFGADNWYDWQIKNWGTKWDIDAELLEDEECGQLRYSFSSAWAPPIEALKNASKLYPELVFILSYDEPGMGFMGITRINNGETEDHSINL